MRNDILFWFWAKLGTEIWPKDYHPVICHLIDVGQVALALWKQSFRELLRSRIATQLGLKTEDAGKWISFCIAAHDIGKVTPCFQFQGHTNDLKRKLEVCNFNTPIGDEHHSVTGTKILFDELIADGRVWPKHRFKLVNKIAVAVGGHHGTFPSSWEQHRNILGNDQWAKARREILENLASWCRRFPKTT